VDRQILSLRRGRPHNCGAGRIAGCPLFFYSIVMGDICGLWRGEWAGASGGLADPQHGLGVFDRSPWFTMPRAFVSSLHGSCGLELDRMGSPSPQNSHVLQAQALQLSFEPTTSRPLVAA